MLAPLLAAVLGSAAAQDLVVHDDWLLEPVPDTVTANGVGSPTVAYDDDTGTWVMLFETRITGATADCGSGRWGIGRATSPDGLAWTADTDLVLPPTDDTYFGCQAAQPTMLHDGTTWHLWFKAVQADTACDGATTPSWGCLPVTGVGHATSLDGIAWTADAEPAVLLSFFGFPKVVRIDDTYELFVAFSNNADRVFDLWRGVSTDGGDTFTLAKAVEAGVAPWAEHELFSPALACTGDPLQPLLGYVGGRVTAVDGQLIEASLSRVVVDDDGTDATWTFDDDSPLITWDVSPLPAEATDNDWRHWDLVRLEDADVVFHAQKDEAGRNRVGIASTYETLPASLDGTTVRGRVCGEVTVPIDDTADSGAPPDDTGAPDDTGEAPPRVDTGDTGTEPPPDPTCGCRTGAPTGALVLLMPLLWRRRR